MGRKGSMPSAAQAARRAAAKARTNMPAEKDWKHTYEAEIFTPYRVALRVAGATKNSTRKREQDWYYIVSLLLISWAKQVMEPRRSGSN